MLVEDDASLREVISTVLETSGYEVVAVADGLEAVQSFNSPCCDIVVLDLMLPTLDGFSVCREIRSKSDVPIIMITARQDVTDVVAGLELGADDYLTKPFEASELLARIRAVLRRAVATDAPATISAGELEIDVAGFRATRSGAEVALSAMEFRLLVELASNLGRVLTREHLIRRVWGYDYLGDSRLVDMAVKRLREKIEPDPANPELIHTVRGAGYRFELPDST